MSLIQQIIVKNKYTLKQANGKGSRGSTPGDYIFRYMARKASVEEITPVQFDAEHYVLRYSARSSATEKASDVPEVKKEFRKIQGKGGVAFGNGDPSLSHVKLLAISRDVQKQFHSGKTILLTLLSFTEEYLREMKVVDEHFEHKGRGSYRGQIDQMKLRLAIMNGIRQLGNQYDDLSYVGVIQVDTNYVHCHLTMVDRGTGTLAKDGTQKGKISETGMNKIRRGVDSYLLNAKDVHTISNDITKDRANVRAFVKSHIHKNMQKRGFFQGVFAQLPEDKRQWRANSNAKPMRNANAMVRSYVEDVLSEPDSGYEAFMADTHAYAAKRVQREGLAQKEYHRLVDAGRERLVKESMNSVYAVLKKVPEDKRWLRTPLLDAASVAYEELKVAKREEPNLEFAFKLKTYAGRLAYHKKEGQKYSEAAVQFCQLDKADVSSQAEVMLHFYEEEAAYHKKCLAKYQHFLGFLPVPKWAFDEMNVIQEEQKRGICMESFLADEELRLLSTDDAEVIGQKRYGIAGGRLLKEMPFVLERQRDAQKAYVQSLELPYAKRLAWEGLAFDGEGLKKKPAYAFSEVKALDLHHMEYDFPYDMEVSDSNVVAFQTQARRRYIAFENASKYLIDTGQEDALSFFAGADISNMYQMAERLSTQPVLLTKVTKADVSGVGLTVPLDIALYEETRKAVQDVMDGKEETLDLETIL